LEGLVDEDPKIVQEVLRAKGFGSGAQAVGAKGLELAEGQGAAEDGVETPADGEDDEEGEYASEGEIENSDGEKEYRSPKVEAALAASQAAEEYYPHMDDIIGSLDSEDHPYIKHLMKLYNEKNLDAMLEVYYKNKMRWMEADLVRMRTYAGKAIGTHEDYEELMNMEEPEKASSSSEEGLYSDEEEPKPEDIRYDGPNIIEYNIMLDACAKAGRHDIALVILDQAVQENALSPMDQYTLMIKAAALSGEHESVQEYWRAYKETGMPRTKAAYAAVMYSLTAQGKFQDAIVHYNKMKRRKVEPTETIFQLLFTSLFAAKEYNIAGAVLHTMRNTPSLSPSMGLMSKVISNFAAVDRLVDVERAMKDQPKGVPFANEQAFMDAFNLTLRLGDEAAGLRVFERMVDAGLWGVEGIDVDFITREVSKWSEETQLSALHAIVMRPKRFRRSAQGQMEIEPEDEALTRNFKEVVNPGAKEAEGQGQQQAASA